MTSSLSAGATLVTIATTRNLSFVRVKNVISATAEDLLMLVWLLSLLSHDDCVGFDDYKPPRLQQHAVQLSATSSNVRGRSATTMEADVGAC